MATPRERRAMARQGSSRQLGQRGPSISGSPRSPQGAPPAAVEEELRRLASEAKRPLLTSLAEATQDTETPIRPETLAQMLGLLEKHPTLSRDVLALVMERLRIDSTQSKHKTLVCVTELAKKVPAFHNSARGSPRFMDQLQKLRTYKASAPHPVHGDKPQMMLRRMATGLAAQLEPERPDPTAKKTPAPQAQRHGTPTSPQPAGGAIAEDQPPPKLSAQIAKLNLKPGWHRPQVQLEGGQEIFGERKQSLDQAMAFAKHRREAERRDQAVDAAVRQAEMAPLRKDRAWGKLAEAVETEAAAHKQPLLSGAGR